MPLNSYGHRPRGRLRKRRKGIYPSGFSKYSLRVIQSPSYSNNNNKRYWDRTEGPTWSALDKCWLGYVIAKDKEHDEDNMRLYAKRIQKLQRQLNREISEFPELGLYAFDEQDNLTYDNEEEEDQKEDELDDDDDEDIPIEDTLDNTDKWNPTGAPVY